MKLITANMKMADAIHSNYLLIPVINRFGIRLGFGDNTIDNICKEYGINVDFFLTIINVFSNADYFPEKKLQTFNVLMIVGYLKKTHKYYRDTQVPIIEKHLKNLIKKSPKENKSLQLVNEFFYGYKAELFAHLKHEETVTFPYVEYVYEMFNAPQKKYSKNNSKQYSMKIYEAEHDEIDEKLFDLKNILIKYINGDFDQATCSEIIFELFRLEKDIKDHARIENNILMPLVSEMEKSLSMRKA